MRNNPTIVLKVPYGLKRKANQKGVYNELMFYYSLKKLSIHGSFRSKGLVSYLSSKLGISSNYIYIQLRKLKNLGWIKQEISNKQESFLSLISYDNLWNDIIYSNKGLKRLELIRIAPNKDIDIQINICEISKSLKEQSKVVFKKYQKKFYSSGCSKNLKRDFQTSSNYRSFLFDEESLVESLKEEQLEIIQSEKTSKVENNWEITLTAKKVSSILGYKTPMSGWNILKKLDALKLIKYVSRKSKPLLVKSEIAYQTFKEMKLDNSFYFSNYNVYKVLPNLITVMKTSL